MNRIILAALTFGFALSGVAVAKETDATRPLSMEVIDQVISQSDRQIQACGRGTKSKDARAVFVHLEIDADGMVRGAEARSVKHDSETACLVKIAKRMRFPKTGTSSKLDFPFVLLPR